MYLFISTWKCWQHDSRTRGLRNTTVWCSWGYKWTVGTFQTFPAPCESGAMTLSGPEENKALKFTESIVQHYDYTGKLLYASIWRWSVILSRVEWCNVEYIKCLGSYFMTVLNNYNYSSSIRSRWTAKYASIKGVWLLLGFKLMCKCWFLIFIVNMF